MINLSNDGTAAARIPGVFVALVLLLATSAWGQSFDDWFRVHWTPEPESATPIPRIEATIHNDSPYRVTDVQRQVDGLDAYSRPVGRRTVWAYGDVAPSGETSFVTETMPGAVDYRITVLSFDLVSAGETLLRGTEVR